MTPPSLAVIKVGGSLFDWPDFPARAAEFLVDHKVAHPDERVLLIAGGGAAADIVRELDRIHGLGDPSAHGLALHSMDFTASILAQILPGTALVDRVDAMKTAWSTGLIPVLAPRLMLDEIERSGVNPLPASWDVTSDSIAARLAIHLEADRLILLKSALLAVGTDRREAARIGLVDPMLPVVARALPRVEYLNLRERASGPQLLM